MSLTESENEKREENGERVNKPTFSTPEAAPFPLDANLP
jgi:hypothetical protein